MIKWNLVCLYDVLFFNFEDETQIFSTTWLVCKVLPIIYHEKLLSLGWTVGYFEPDHSRHFKTRIGDASRGFVSPVLCEPDQKLCIARQTSMGWGWQLSTLSLITWDKEVCPEWVCLGNARETSSIPALTTEPFINWYIGRDTWR